MIPPKIKITAYSIEDQVYNCKTDQMDDIKNTHIMVGVTLNNPNLTWMSEEEIIVPTETLSYGRLMYEASRLVRKASRSMKIRKFAGKRSPRKEKANADD